MDLECRERNATEVVAERRMLRSELLVSSKYVKVIKNVERRFIN